MAKQYLEDRDLFKSTAAYWTENFARPEKSKEEKLMKLVDMGFSKPMSEEALQRYDFNEELALNFRLENAYS